MFITPVFFIFLLITTIVLAIGLIISVHTYSKLVGKLSSLNKENLDLKEHIDQKSINALLNLQKQTEEIILQADKKAAGILDEAKLFPSQEKNEMAEKLKTIIDTQTDAFYKINKTMEQEYQNTLAQTKDSSIKLFTNITKSISDAATSEISDFKKVLEDETVSSEKLVQNKVSEAYDQIEQELASYRKQKMEQVDKDAVEKMHAIARFVLGNGLSIEQQEFLVKNAIDSLKKQVS